jgi:hypothetical protein
MKKTASNCEPCETPDSTHDPSLAKKRRSLYLREHDVIHAKLSCGKIPDFHS